MDFKKAFVTGGAGFIGSHVVDYLLESGKEVTVYDNFSTGQEQFLAKAQKSSLLKVLRGDILDFDSLNEAIGGHDFIFHLAAHADLKENIKERGADLEQNTVATWKIAEAAQLNGVKGIAFSSTAAVYGEPDVFPTPETYAGRQTSLYGASKLAAEGLLEAYSEYFAIDLYTFRFVSWLGERYTHGCVFDFVKKLKSNPKELEIYGDGNQVKSFLL